MTADELPKVATDIGRVELLLCRALRGEATPWPEGEAAEGLEALLPAVAARHGVLGLLAEIVQPDWHWPASVQAGIRHDAMRQALRELRHRQLLAKTLVRLRERRIEAVLLKGTALAYSLYANPAARGRGDTDILVRPEERAAAGDVLDELGFTQQVAISGQFVSSQASHVIEVDDSGPHCFDVHWRISNSYVLSRLVDADRIRRRAVALDRLCPGAIGIGLVDALVHACLHRAGHTIDFHDDSSIVSGDRLIWLYDIHLIACALGAASWQDGLLAEIADCAPAIGSALTRAQACFSTPYPRAAIGCLPPTGLSVELERYLAGGRWRRNLMDAAALPRWSERLALARETMFPEPGYMRAKYPSLASRPVAVLHARRMLDALRRQAQLRQAQKRERSGKPSRTT